MNLFFSSARRLALALTALALASCEINYTDGLEAAPTNTCAGDDECASGASCIDQRCIGTNVDLSDLIVEVHPNSGASYGASKSFIFPVNKSFAGLGDAAFNVHYDIKLPAPAALTGGMVHLDYPTKCALGAKRSIPAKITFDHVTALAGLQGESITVEAVKKTEASTEYEFDANLLPGKYSVYIQPQPIEGCEDATPPPVFYPAQDISASADGQVLQTDWAVSKTTTIGGEILLPQNGNFAGWTLDMVEPAGGRVISTTQTLVQDPLGFAVNVQLSFVWNDKTVSPYIRLRPPEGQAMPSVYWGLIESLSSQLETAVHLSITNLEIKPRVVTLQVVDPDHNGVFASVQIQSVSLSGDVKKNAIYAVDLDKTDANGLFPALLPPGTYNFRARPLDSKELATSDFELIIPSLEPNMDEGTCFCGRVIPVAKKASVTGSILTPMGTPLAGASITMNPSQPEAVNYWKRVVQAPDASSLASQDAIATSTEAGAFALQVAPGPSDLTVRPVEGSGYPWLVRPRVQVQATSGVQFGELTLPNPALLRGIVTNPSGAPAANVVVGGWLPVRSADGSAPTTVIQVGATTTDENGQYTLILPASISQ